MKLGKSFNALCSPARFYLAISGFLVALILVQNLMNGNAKELCVGAYSCDVPNVGLFFALKALYVFFWTWVLNLLCKYGLKSLSWFLVLIPFLLFAIILGVLIYTSIMSKNNANRIGPRPVNRPTN